MSNSSWWPTGQNLEDVFLYRCFRELPSGRYLDVGAGNPKLPSVTLSFYRIGWSGILLDASKLNVVQLKHDRPNDLVLNFAVSNKVEEASFYEFEGLGISTLDYEIAEYFESSLNLEYQKRYLRTNTLNSILELQSNTNFEFLKIDVEGFEKEVLEGINLLQYRPKVIVVEAVDPVRKSRTSATFRQILTNSKYIFAYFDGLNEFFVSKEESQLLRFFSQPISILDGPYFKNG